jgi:6-phosphogluconate dehydrogenase
MRLLTYFEEWNDGKLNLFLIEITRDIMRYKDTDGLPLMKNIRDTEGQKGTGKWTVIFSLDFSVLVILIGEAVFSRCHSALKDECVRANKILSGPDSIKVKIRSPFIVLVRHSMPPRSFLTHKVS